MFFYDSPYENNKDKHAKEVDKFLLEQQAKTDALYPYQSNSASPVVEGAWKGALASSILAKGHEYWKREKNPSYKMGFKPFLGYTLGGATAGSLFKYIDNQLKVKQKKDALNYLHNNRPNSNYVKDKQKLLKTSTSQGIKSIATDGSENAREDYERKTLPPKQTQKQIAEKSGISGALGATLGGTLSALFMRRPGAFKRGAVTGASLGASSEAVSDEANNTMNEENVQMPLSHQLALTGALSGMVEPLVYRGIGYGAAKTKKHEFLKDIMNANVDKEDIKDVKEKLPFKDGYGAAKHYAENSEKVPMGRKLLHTFAPNIMAKTKKFYDSDDVDMYKGSKGKLFDKQLARHMTSKALWGAALGYLPIKAMDMLKEKKQNNAKNN